MAIGARLPRDEKAAWKAQLANVLDFPSVRVIAVKEFPRKIVFVFDRIDTPGKLETFSVRTWRMDIAREKFAAYLKKQGGVRKSG